MIFPQNSIVPVMQNVSIRQETNFYDENISKGKGLTRQVDIFFRKVIPTGFPQRQKSFFDLFFDKKELTYNLFLH